MKWFNDPESLEDLKKQYRALALRHHPDCGGTVNDMQQINAVYDLLFETLKNTHQTSDGITFISSEITNESPNEFRDVIDRLISFDGLHIEICGSWIWITGNTLNHKEDLKQMHFRWSKSKSAWYFHRDGYSKATKRTYTLNEIRDLYGSETIAVKQPLKLSIV